MNWSIEGRLISGVALALALLLVNALVSYRATRKLIDNERLIAQTHQVLTELEATMSTMKDAETGERGFIITGQEAYLQPYQSALNEIHTHVEKLRQLTLDNPNQQARITVLEGKIAERLASLKTGIEMRMRGDAEGARQLIASGVGKGMMDDLRQFINVMEGEEEDLLNRRAAESKASGRDAFLTDFVANLIACALLSLISLVIFRDITARRRAEEALRQQREWLEVTLSSIGDAVITTDINGFVSFLNPVAQGLTGWKLEEAVGQRLHEIFNIVNEETRQTVENPALRAMREGVIVGLANHTVLIAKDRSEIPIDDSGAPIKDTDGKIIGAVLIFRDITERRRIERERSQLLAGEQAAREQAEAASRAKDEFVAVISHEIRSPLNSILGWAQMLKTGRLNKGEADRAIETIERNARMQVQLVEDLLDISRVITGKLTLNVRPVELTEIIELALDAIRPAAEAKAIELRVQLAPSGSVISGDPNRLQQIVWNLLSNAVKFTPRHGRIEVRMERVNSQVQITVRDSGIGINPEFLPFVFDRFSQASTTSERKYGGLGLGLAIVRHLVELHGGTVWADSSGEGRGAIFTVAFPVGVLRPGMSEFKRIDPSAGPLAYLNDAIRIDGLRVIIVDDETESRELLTVMLMQHGAEVKACASAAEALEEIERWQPHVLVSDIGMPDEDGYALIRKLRAREPARGGNIPAVALTGYAKLEDRLRALASGFQLHVSKPVEAAELITVIASLSGRIDKGKMR